MRIENLIESLPKNYGLVDRDLILRAYRFAEHAHQGQKRASGEPYITHCLAVAAILAEMRVPPVVIISGLLHDTVEDTPVTLDAIRLEFGEEVAKLVDGVTKLTNLPRVSRDDQHAEILDHEFEERGDSRGRPVAETLAPTKSSKKGPYIRNPAQNIYGDGRGCPCCPHQIGGPPAQYAHTWIYSGAKKAADCTGNAGYFCSPGQPPWDLAN